MARALRWVGIVSIVAGVLLILAAVLFFAQDSMVGVVLLPIGVFAEIAGPVLLTIGKLVGPRLKAPVPGVLRIVGITMPSSGAMYTNYRLHGIVTAPGIPATPVEQQGMGRVSRWPSPGDEVPVLVDRTDPTHFAIQWKRIPDSGQQAARLADQLAAQLRAGGAMGTNGATPGFPTVLDLRDPTRPAPGTPGGGTTPEEARQLLVTGERATATVLSASPVPVPAGITLPPNAVPGGGWHDLMLDVTRADGSHYQTRIRVGFSTPERRDIVARAGTSVPVRLDPSDLTRTVIDTVALGFG
jgi:hypothetical protein